MRDAIWQAFRETGDPLCYLLYRAAIPKRDAEKREIEPKTA